MSLPYTVLNVSTVVNLPPTGTLPTQQCRQYVSVGHSEILRKLGFSRVCSLKIQLCDVLGLKATKERCQCLAIIPSAAKRVAADYQHPRFLRGHSHFHSSTPNEKFSDIDI